MSVFQRKAHVDAIVVRDPDAVAVQRGYARQDSAHPHGVDDHRVGSRRRVPPTPYRSQATISFQPSDVPIRKSPQFELSGTVYTRHAWFDVSAARLDPAERLTNTAG